MNKVLQILFLMTNCLFIAKYTGRTSINPLLTSALYCGFVLLLFFLIEKIHRLKKKWLNITIFGLSALVVVVIAVSYAIIDPYSIQVDRWSAIHNFIQNLFNGSYPYSARTHLGGYGSPFPVWQFFHVPFYLMGNVGIGMLFSYLLLFFFLLWYFDNRQQVLIYLILLAVSPAFWYEAAVRSDLMYNFILCFIAIAYLYKKKYSIQNNAIMLGILCGMFLSTRFSIVVPFAIYLFPDFLRAKISKKTGFTISGLIVFVASFLPFVFWDFNTLFFFDYNPFVLQMRQGSVIEALVIGSMGIYLSLCWKDDFVRCTEYISVTLVALVVITFLHRMIKDRFNAGLFDSAYDITYLNMALPFILFSLTKRFNTKPIV